MVVPTNHDRAAVAPNFFVEAKAPRGGANVAKRQACLDGAVGARAMHSLQNYGEDEAVYDDNAYTYSTTFHNGQLMLYAHHVTKTPSGPEYHMTQLKGYTLTSDRETFVAGATAFRNARDLARRQRTSFVEAANVRASQSESAASQGIEATEHSVDVLDLVPYANYGARQDADDALQQHVAETSGLNLDHETVATSIPQNLFEGGDRRDLGQDSTLFGVEEPSMSLTSSFITTSTERTRSKRSRLSSSPPSLSKKSHNVWEGIQDIAQPSKLHGVDTYLRKGQMCFQI